MRRAAAPPTAATPKGASSFSKRTPASTATWSPKWWRRRPARCFSSSPTRPIRSPTWRAGSPHTTVCSAPARCSTACACVFISPRGSGSIPFRSRPRSSASTALRRCFSGRQPAWAACRSPRLCRQERRWRTCAAASSTTCATPTSRSSKATRRASSASASSPPVSPKPCCATSGRCCLSAHTTPATASLCPCRASSGAKASAASSSRRCRTRNGAPSPKAPRCFAKLYRGSRNDRYRRCTAPGAPAIRHQHVVPHPVPSDLDRAGVAGPLLPAARELQRRGALGRDLRFLGEGSRPNLRPGRGLRRDDELPVRHQLAGLYEDGRKYRRPAAFLRDPVRLFSRGRIHRRDALRRAARLVALGTTISAFWILALDSWMQTPAGFTMIDGQAHVASWLAVIFNPSFPYRLTHMLLASGLTVAFLVAGIAAYPCLHQ